MSDCVCGECGHEQVGDLGDKCQKCGSFRTVLLSFVKEHFGEDWKEKCFGKKPEDK
jgi:hypothetical protein